MWVRQITGWYFPPVNFSKKKRKKKREEKIANIKVGSVLTGIVESLQNYGAFVRLEDGLSGLVHVSQISQKRIKFPKDVLNVGDEVQVKVIGVKDGKISLSMKALEEAFQEEEEVKVEIPRARHRNKPWRSFQEHPIIKFSFTCKTKRSGGPF